MQSDLQIRIVLCQTVAREAGKAKVDSEPQEDDKKQPVLHQMLLWLERLRSLQRRIPADSELLLLSRHRRELINVTKAAINVTAWTLMRIVLHMHTLIIQLSELHAEFLKFKILIIQLSELHAEFVMFNTLIILHPSERHAYRLFQTCLRLQKQHQCVWILHSYHVLVMCSSLLILSRSSLEYFSQKVNFVWYRIYIMFFLVTRMHAFSLSHISKTNDYTNTLISTKCLYKT